MRSRPAGGTWLSRLPKICVRERKVCVSCSRTRHTKRKARRAGERVVATNHNKLPFNVLHPIQTIVLLPLPQRMRVHISSEIAHGRPHPPIKRAPESQMPAQTHPRRADAAIARFELGEAVDAEGRVFVVGGDFLGDFPGVAVVGAFGVVGEGRRAGEFVVAAGGRDDVAVGGDLTGEALNGASDCGGVTMST